jgi:hypothetical protein
MDILTPKGQETLQQEQMAIRMFTENFRGFDFVETPKDKPADIDGFIVKDGVLVSGVEVKCRNMSAYELKTHFKNRWLITENKLSRGIGLCRSLGVDFRGFLYLVPDKLLMIVPLWSFDRGYIADIVVDHATTQATVNGGTALRLNAYVDVAHAKCIAEL